MAALNPATRETSSTLLLAVDGQKHEIQNPDPTLTLSDYLRSTGHVAVKIGCGEGGCGACMVTVASWSPGENKPTYKAVNSCLMPLCSCSGLSVTTSMGLGNSAKGFHPIQERLAAHNGSQCGFCSPGMVMSIFGLLSSQKGDKCPSESQMEACVEGNLCRCTGYRSILSAAKSFAGTPKEEVAGEKFAPFPEFLKEAVTQGSGNKTHRFTGSGKEWLSPPTLQGLFHELAEQSSRTNLRTSMIAGHTCRGIYKDDHTLDVLVDISRIPELNSIEKSSDGITFGGAVTWGGFISTLQEIDAAEKPEFAALPVLVEHALKVAGPGIRNLGTLGGNLVMTKHRGFQSDLATILAGVGASVTILNTKSDTAQVPLHDFFAAEYRLPESAVLEKVFVPFLSAGEVFKSYRTAIRQVNSHALTNAAFAVGVADGRVASARLVFGALGSREAAPGPSAPETSEGAGGRPLRALKTEAAILGQAVGADETLQAALKALTSEAWWPEDAFERHLVQSNLYKFFHTLRASRGKTAPPLGVSLSSERPVTAASQLVAWATPDMAPIAESMPKLAAKLQAAGEQRFTNDLPEPKDCLYAAYVQIPRAKAVLVDFDLTAAQEMPGFVGTVGADDIPGSNAYDPFLMKSKLFVPKGEASQFAGQPCLLILADSTKHAEAAARAVELELRMEEAPVLTIDAYLSKNKDIKAAKTIERGSVAEALPAAPHRVAGEMFCDGQKAFYMEPPASLVVPGEDGTLAVWGTFQVPSWAHDVVTSCTSLPKHKVVVNVTHIGGGFGGKLTKPMHVVCAAAVAAAKTKRAVRMHLNRNVDTVLCGGRHPMSIKYEAGFDQKGKISAIRVQTYVDAGVGDACSSFTLAIALKNMEQIYGIPNLDLTGYMCNTDKPGNTAVRGPGEPQAAFIMETILEHIAADLGIGAQEVREANIFTSPEDMQKVAASPTSKDVEQYSAMLKIDDKDCGGTKFMGFPALGIWTMLKQKVNFDDKAAAVAKFNSEHRWRKRGLAMTPVKYEVGTRGQQALVCLYTDGTCLITCDGTEIGQGLHTKVVQYAAYYLSQIVPGDSVPLASIRVGPNGTDKVAHGSITGGSTTSEGVCEAVRIAIEKLKANLQPTKEKLEADGKPVTLKSLLGAASGSTELQASGKCEESLKYHCYGACVSEVEVDVLSGEAVILSSSLLYDCGKSLNPAIDLGQCEGAFIMGVGFFLRERLVQDNSTGQLATDGTWEYKIPCSLDVPLQFDVEFFPRPFSEGGIASSKASGEPPLVLSSSVFCAVKQAVRAARQEFGRGAGNFRLDAPCTPRDIALAIGAAPEGCKI